MKQHVQREAWGDDVGGRQGGGGIELRRAWDIQV